MEENNNEEKVIGSEKQTNNQNEIITQQSQKLLETDKDEDILADDFIKITVKPEINAVK